MQSDFSAIPPLASPNGAASAYGNIIRRTENPRDIEYRLFEQITSELESAAPAETHFSDRIKAVHRNRELWQTLAADLADSENAFPEELRAGLIGIAFWVTRETDRVMHHDAPLHDLIGINRTIMQGLRPKPPEPV